MLWWKQKGKMLWKVDDIYPKAFGSVIDSGKLKIQVSIASYCESDALPEGDDVAIGSAESGRGRYLEYG
jgi:hypothetical protein